jgi:class 3 adenylate cyclase
VVGDLIGAGAAQERGVIGETPNLAARLQALARPGTLVVGDSTRSFAMPELALLKPFSRGRDPSMPSANAGRSEPT